MKKFIKSFWAEKGWDSTERDFAIMFGCLGVIGYMLVLRFPLTWMVSRGLMEIPTWCVVIGAALIPVVFSFFYWKNRYNS